MILMAFALLLATRSRVLERFFGGLDRMYALHRQAGTWIFLLLLLHFLVMPLNPDQVPPGRAPGYIAFGGFILLILLSLAPRIPIIRRIVRAIGDGESPINSLEYSSLWERLMPCSWIRSFDRLRCRSASC
ncbi:ferric reductase-like transmembrane domain-containing protein [Cohnella xylanilytica]|uniref:ferric reductase-like transmembrane domain-containing protein n=1 Tax=Cohnella xylanilytica TaxID=557555 RepID=UPI0035712BF0